MKINVLFFNFNRYLNFFKNVIYFLSVLPLIFITESKINAQTYDNKFWSGLSINLPITKKLELSAEYEMRRNNDMEFIDWHISDIGISYGFNKEVKLSASYNYRSGKDRWQHVFNGNFHYDNKFWKIKYTYRLRYQEKHKYKFEWNNEGEKRIEKGLESQIRNRILLEYDTDTWIKPFTGFELFYLIEHADYPRKIKKDGDNFIFVNKYSDRFNILRLYLGVDIDTFKDQQLSVYYMAEHEFNIAEPNTSNVIGIFYTIDLPKLF